jgi:hypothetical protein
MADETASVTSASSKLNLRIEVRTTYQLDIGVVALTL